MAEKTDRKLLGLVARRIANLSVRDWMSTPAETRRPYILAAGRAVHAMQRYDKHVVKGRVAATPATKLDL